MAIAFQSRFITVPGHQGELNTQYPKENRIMSTDIQCPDFYDSMKMQ